MLPAPAHGTALHSGSWPTSTATRLPGIRRILQLQLCAGGLDVSDRNVALRGAHCCAAACNLLLALQSPLRNCPLWCLSYGWHGQASCRWHTRFSGWLASCAAVSNPLGRKLLSLCLLVPCMSCCSATFQVTLFARRYLAYVALHASLLNGHMLTSLQAEIPAPPAALCLADSHAVPTAVQLQLVSHSLSHCRPPYVRQAQARQRQQCT